MNPIDQWFPNSLGPPPPWFHNHPQCPLPYPIKIILQNSGLHNPLRKIIKIKEYTTFSYYFTVSKFVMGWMGLMK
jgi:hypothetical protein